MAEAAVSTAILMVPHHASNLTGSSLERCATVLDPGSIIQRGQGFNNTLHGHGPVRNCHPVPTQL
jgi:hypothetical protein